VVAAQTATIGTLLLHFRFPITMLHSSTLGKMQKRLLLLLVACALVAGCTMGTTVVGNEPSGLMASTLTISSIRVYWTRNPSDLTTDTVIVMLGSNIVATVTAPYLGSTNDSATVPGLASGIQYTIIVGSEAGESQPYTYTLQLTYLPTNVAVIAIDSLSITVVWTRNFNDTSADTLEVTNTTGQYAGDAPIIAPPGKDTETVTGLMPGVTYVITVVCTTGSSTALQYTEPGLPTSVMVNAMNASTIGVIWTRGVADTMADTIVARINSDTGPIAATSIVTGDTGTVSGLVEMKPYVITIHMSTGISDTPITWMTAERYTGIQIYEMSDTNPGDPRGLVLAANGTKPITLPNALLPDLILDTNSASPSGLELAPGDSDDMIPAGNATPIDPNYNIIPGGLNYNYRDSGYASDTLVDAVLPVIIPSDSAGGSLVIVCKTVTGNWALIEIDTQTNDSGRVYNTAANGFKYITVNVSYQAMANAPYAGRGHPRATKPVLKKPLLTAKKVFRNSPSSAKPVTSTPASSSKPVIKNSSH
jgi:hypothetical protein